VRGFGVCAVVIFVANNELHLSGHTQNYSTGGDMSKYDHGVVFIRN